MNKTNEIKIIERNYELIKFEDGDFSLDVSLGKKILRLLIGIVILLGVKEGFKILFGLFTDKELIILDLIRYMFVGLSATALVPLMFKNKFNSKGI